METISNSISLKLYDQYRGEAIKDLAEAAVSVAKQQDLSDWLSFLCEVHYYILTNNFVETLDAKERDNLAGNISILKMFFTELDKIDKKVSKGEYKE